MQDNINYPSIPRLPDSLGVQRARPSYEDLTTMDNMGWDMVQAGYSANHVDNTLITVLDAALDVPMAEVHTNLMSDN